MTEIIKAIIILIVYLLLQVVFFRFGVFANGWMIIFFHIYGFLLLPIGWHKTSYLFIGAISGMLIDILLFTGGLHMAAGTVLGLCMPLIYDLLGPRVGFQKGHVISGLNDGWVRFLMIGFALLFTYTFTIFAIEGARFSILLQALGKSLMSSSLTLILFGITHGLIGIIKKTKRTKVSAYPWS